MSLLIQPFVLRQEEAITYIQQELALGWGFSQALLLELNLSNGDVVTFLPSLLSETDALKFNMSVYKTAGVNFREDLDNHVAHRISVFLENRSNSYFIAETLMAGVPVFPKKALDDNFMYDGRLYLYADKSGSRNTIKSVFRRSRDYPLITSLTSLPDQNPKIKSGNTLSDKLLQELAKRTEVLIIGAYDAEAFVIWRKTEDAFPNAT
ncbi:MAG: hypothetical protein KJZ77_16120 [Anaerolineales bacterium]|nr:hypothetical protein [Anaerolineales bacterium]